MEITYTKGNKHPKDRIIRITTKENEWFSIFKISLLANQLAINEMNINGDKIRKNGKFFFSNALKEAIDMAEKGVDWGEEENIDKVKSWCRKYIITFEKIEPELKKCLQKKLEVFDNENKQ